MKHFLSIPEYILWSAERWYSPDAITETKSTALIGLGLCGEAWETWEAYAALAACKEKNASPLLLKDLAVELGDWLYYWARAVASLGRQLDITQALTVPSLRTPKMAISALLGCSCSMAEIFKKVIRDEVPFPITLEELLVKSLEVWLSAVRALGLDYRVLLLQNVEKVAGRYALVNPS